MSDKVIDRSGWNYTIVDNDIIETDKLTIYEKMIYIALKRFANIQTQEAFPGVRKLAEYARISHRKARDVLGYLAEKKLIHIEYRENNTSVYTILKIPADYSGHAHGAGGHAHGAGGVMHTVPGGHAHGAPELKKLELKKDELKKLKDIAPLENSVYEDIIKHLNESTEQNFRASSKKTQSLINARFKDGFTIGDFKTVIDKKSAEWLQDKKMNKYLRPETLFGSKFEGYLNQKGGQADATNKNAGNVADEYGLDF